MSQIGNVITSTIISLGFGFSEKSKNEKLEKELAQIGEQKQQELLEKLLVLKNQIERQQLITKYINDQKIEQLKKENNKKRYIRIGVLIASAVAIFFIFKKLRK